MECKFGVKLDSVSENSVQVRLYSENKVDLVISQVKAFSKSSKPTDLPLANFTEHLNNSYKVRCFGDLDKSVRYYASLCFIVKDKTNKEQFAISIPLNGDSVKYTKMAYEGV